MFSHMKKNCLIQIDCNTELKYNEFKYQSYLLIACKTDAKGFKYYFTFDLFYFPFKLTRK